MNELVSVVIATYRRDFSLRCAIESLTSQTYNEVEILVVDDNADDGWNEKISSIVADFSNIKYIRNLTNQGSAKTRNIGIREAKGKYITFLDDDDIYLPEKIEHQVNEMKKCNADFSLTDLYLYSEDNKLVDRRVRSYIRNCDKESLLKDHLMYHMTGTDTMMFKREYLLKIGGFPGIDVGDEFYLMSKAIENGGKFIYVPGCYVKAYIHTGDIGLSSGQSKIDGENSLFEYKKTKFEQLNKKSQRYIKMRHHAVLAFAYLKIGDKKRFLHEGISAFFCDPLKCLKLLASR